MRNSPIAYLGTINNLSLQQILLLTDIFCKITHPHIDSLTATRTHSTLIHFLLKNILYKENIKQCFTSDAYSLLTISRPIKFSSVNIKPLEFWLKEKENKVLVIINKNSDNPYILIIDKEYGNIEFSQNGVLSFDIDLALGDKNKNIHWVIKSINTLDEVCTENIIDINITIWDNGDTFWGELIIHADSGGIRDESNDMYWKRLSFKGIQGDYQ